MPVPGAPGWLGVIFNFYADQPEGERRRYGRLGNSYVAVVEFGPAPRSRSVLVFGQSMHEGTPHYEDQSALYAAGRFKDNFWTRSAVLKNTRPGRPLRS
jgi:acyl-homoserine lactone acylase PvdQ